MFVGNFDHTPGYLETFGYQNTGELKLKEPSDGLFQFIFRELIKIGYLGLAKDLNPLGEKVLDEPHESHTGTVDITHRDIDFGGEGIGERLEAQIFFLLLVEASSGQALQWALPGRRLAPRFDQSQSSVAAPVQDAGAFTSTIKEYQKL